MPLTGKKLAFANAVLAGKSNKQAAIAAGYSAATASPAGSRLAKEKAVVEYLAKQRGVQGGSPDGVKVQGVPPDWPFGTQPAAPPAAPAVALVLTAEDYLRQVVNDEDQEPKLRIEAAKKLIDFEKAKPAPVGKKAARAEEAKQVGKTSRFAAGAPPKLAANNGKRV